MKKLIVLTAVAMVTVGGSGCRLCDWMRRGAPAHAIALPAPIYCDPCDPCATPTAAPCDACAPGRAMMVAPGPETYLPGPVR